MSVVSGTMQALASGSAASQQASAYSSAAAQQAAATQSAVDLQREIWQSEQNSPYTQAAIKQGTSALNQLASNTLSGQYGKQYTTDDFKNSALYQTLIGQQSAAKDLTTAQQAASGMMGSGNMQNALQTNLANLAGTYEQAAFNQWNTSNQEGYNSLANLAGIGGSSTNSLNSAGQNYATNTGNTLMSGAQAVGTNLVNSATASGSGTIGMANALAGMSNNAWNQGLAAYLMF